MLVRREAVFRGVLDVDAGSKRLKAGEGATRAALLLNPAPDSRPCMFPPDHLCEIIAEAL